MPFAMIHLNVALNILEKSDEIREPEQFLLGALAPDAVHFMDNYNSWMKHKSHFCVGEEPWGSVTNNNEWLDNIKINTESYRSYDERDFYLGYFTHIITDLRNNIKIWLPFKESVKNDNTPGISKRYHEESNLVDIWLYHKANKVINCLLEKSHAVGIGDISVEAVEALKKSFMFERYKDTNILELDLSENQYVKVKEVQKFIEDEAKYVYKILFET